MAILYDDIEHAFMYVSADQKYMNNAYLCRETGEVYYASEMYGSPDELPEDIDDSDKYIAIPHKSDLNLGKTLVLEFVAKYLPAEFDHVHLIFSSRGAYSRYKDLLEQRGSLDKWYEFEDGRQKAALEQWCLENNIMIDG